MILPSTPASAVSAVVVTKRPAIRDFGGCLQMLLLVDGQVSLYDVVSTVLHADCIRATDEAQDLMMGSQLATSTCNLFDVVELYGLRGHIGDNSQCHECSQECVHVAACSAQVIARSWTCLARQVVARPRSNSLGG
jgi:hypothetical protein